MCIQSLTEDMIGGKDAVVSARMDDHLCHKQGGACYGLSSATAASVDLDTLMPIESRAWPLVPFFLS